MATSTNSILDTEIANKVAQALLDIEAVSLKANVEDYFTWASGIKSPIYCDNRKTLSFPEVRNLVIDSFAKLIKEKYPSVEVIAGVATAGIPHAALIADRLGLSMIYVRSKAKEHGKTNQIEGVFTEGQKVVVIEDLISTGGSSLKAVDALKEANAEILGLSAIFSYELDKAQQNFATAQVDYFTLSNYPALIAFALEQGKVTEEQATQLLDWRSSL